MRFRISAVVRARNEENHIEKSIVAVKSQTVAPDRIILVDDGSTDNTRKIATELGCTVVNLPFHKNSHVGTPKMAETWNAGLQHMDKNTIDYVLLLDADHILPDNYVEEILKRMQRNPRLVIASGWIREESFEENWPRGSGRIVEVHFWKELNNMLYPILWCWEEWLCHKAMQLGYEVRAFHDVPSEVQRRTGRRSFQAWGWGKAMYCLGYDWKTAMVRCLITFFDSPKLGVSMFRGWLQHDGVEKADISSWVNHRQKREFHKRVLKFLKRRRH